jgi:hypothetical protein
MTWEFTTKLVGSYWLNLQGQKGFANAQKLYLKDYKLKDVVTK